MDAIEAGENYGRLQSSVVMSVLFCGLLLIPELSCSQFSEFDSNKMINRGKTLKPFNKFSQLISQGNVWRRVRRICM